MRMISVSAVRGSATAFAAALLLAVAGTSSGAATNDAGHPPQFTTIPMHARMVGVEVQSGHIVYQPPVAANKNESIGGEAPPPGKGGGGGGGGGGSGGSDFGLPGAVAATLNCFANSANNFDVTCAQDSYQGEPMVMANGVASVLIGSENDIYPGNCSSTASPGAFGDCAASVTASSAGVNWQRFKASRTFGGHTFLISFDPSVAVDSQGRAFFAFGLSDGGASGPNGIAAVSSADGGVTWTKTNPVVLNLSGHNFEDKYWLAADNHVGSTFQDRLYIAWDRNSGNNQILLVSHSSDHGQTWSAPVKINDGTTKFERVIGAFPAVGPDGVVHVLWHDYARNIIFMDKSSDGGNTFGADVAVATTHTGFGVDIGCNGGRSMGPAPAMAIDPAGNIYVVFADQPAGAGNTFDVFLTKSTNGGASWSTPRRVSATGAGEQYNPAVFYNAASAEVEVAYLDRRDDPADCRTNTFLSRSADGGATFTDAKVTDVDSDFDGNPNGPGDYGTVTVLGTTTFPYFADHRDANAVVDGTTGTIDGGFEIYSAVKP